MINPLVLTYKNRIVVFDIIKVTCIIWIVFIWHFCDYLPQNNGFKGYVMTSPVCKSITNNVLGIFCFISGILTNLLFPRGINATRLYYYKQLKQYYIPYALACITLYITPTPIGGQFLTEGQLILSIIGIQELAFAPIATLWYMNMLLIFLFVAPIIVKQLLLLKRIVLSISIYALFLILSNVLDIIDPRFITYMPFFLLGLNIPLDKILLVRIELSKNIVADGLCLFSSSVLSIYLFHRQMYYFFLQYMKLPILIVFLLIISTGILIQKRVIIISNDTCLHNLYRGDKLIN